MMLGMLMIDDGTGLYCAIYEVSSHSKYGRTNAGDLNQPHYMKRHDMGIEREIITLW